MSAECSTGTCASQQRNLHEPWCRNRCENPLHEGVHRDRIVRIWRASLAHLAIEGVRLHVGCDNDPPEECSLFEVIQNAMDDDPPHTAIAGVATSPRIVE